MATLTKFIGKGATRLCFEHPTDEHLCVKVAMRYKEEHILDKELKVYLTVKDNLVGYIPHYEETLLSTNLGKGLVIELLRDENGAYSKSLNKYIKNGSIDNDLATQLKSFADVLVKRNIYFYDFNLENFTVQVRNEGRHLYYTDLKSYQKYKPWTFLKLEKVIPFLAKYLMKKRLNRLFRRLKLTDFYV